MVLFDFICRTCSNEYEQLMMSDSVPVCPDCGDTDNQQKVISAPKIAYATNDDSPKTQRDLQNYLGNGEYVRGYKMG